MKSLLKLFSLAGGIFCFGFLVVWLVSITHWEDNILKIKTNPTTYAHKIRLKNLWIWNGGGDWNENYAWISPGVDNLNILNGLVVWKWNHNVADGVEFIVVGGWDSNTINSSYAWIVGWKHNTIAEEAFDSAIGWWFGNNVWWENTVIAWWSENTTSAGFKWWVIIWWSNNSVENDYGVVLGGYSNSADQYWLSLGYGSVWAAKSFSWGSDWVQANESSSNIQASGGVLIWTYTPIENVNLVVGGAVKIAWDWDNTSWVAWEIRMYQGCFYAYDGKKRHVFGRSSEDNCNHMALAGRCVFWNTKLWEWDQVTAYKTPYAIDCNSQKSIVTCKSDGSMDSTYIYPYCYNLSS